MLTLYKQTKLIALKLIIVFVNCDFQKSMVFPNSFVVHFRFNCFHASGESFKILIEKNKNIAGDI